MSTYSIATGNGDMVTEGVGSRELAQSIAQTYADECGETVEVYTPRGHEQDGEWIADESWTVEPTEQS